MTLGFGNQPADQIYLGFGDPPVPTMPPGLRSQLPEATIVPEPAGLMLFFIGSAFLARRRGHCEVRSKRAFDKLGYRTLS
jgi:hypothetical protein